MTPSRGSLRRGAPLSRRAFLAAAAGGLAATAAGCSSADDSVRRAAPAPGPGDVTGPFDWRRASGTTIDVLLPRHVRSDALVDDLGSFMALTGIEVRTSVAEPAGYFDTVTRSLVAGLGDVDVFMTDASTVWQYAPPGWMEDLDPWLDDPTLTGPGYEPEDLESHLATPLRWDLVLGSPTGGGSRWALPLGSEPNGIVYRADVLARLGLRPPETFDELDDVCRAVAPVQAAAVAGGYSLAVQGTASWTTVNSGFLTQYARHGLRDYVLRSGQLAPAVASSESVAFHGRWMDLVRDTGPRPWTEQTPEGCVSHLRHGKAALSYDSLAGPLPTAPGATDEPPLAWSPGPAGPGGSLVSHQSIWSLAMSSRSREKVAAWLFLQWATGPVHARYAALNGCADPARTSLLDDAAYRATLAPYPGYLDTADALRGTARVAFTPQPAFFDVTTAWAASLQEMHRGRDPRASLGELAQRFRLRS